MANVCSSCSTDNADGALVCRQCGAALTSAAAWSRSLIPEDDTFDPLSAPTLVMQHTAPAVLPDIEETQPVAPENGTGRRLLWGLSGFVVLLGAGLWLLRPSAEAPAAAAPPVATAAASAVALAASMASPASAPASAAPAVAPAASASAAEPAVAAAVAVADPLPPALPASAVERRKRIPEPVIRRPVPASAPAAPASEPAPPPAPPPPAPAPQPVRPRTVAELCAGSNLLTRGFCEHRECAKAELAGDPVCVRLKEAEEARRLRQ
jgi:pyruvate/2-oxoglutarate dehydrogenase complex dihydrolipoamide acyltransferase (E2) component